MEGKGGDEISVEELAANLVMFKAQHQHVKEALAFDPRNIANVDLERDIREVCSMWRCSDSLSLPTGFSHRDSSFDFNLIAVTEEVLSTAKQNQNVGPDSGTSGTPSPNFSQSQKNANDTDVSDYNDKFPPGTKVQAVWSEDGEWYDATINSLTSNGYFVTYDGWGNKEMVDPDNVRPIQEGAVNVLLEAERVAEATKQAIKRKIERAASVDFQSKTLPAKLRIEPDDPEDVKTAKRKKIHAFKSKMRMEQLEVTQNKRQNAWQQFQTTKGKTKKSGYLTGRKRESIFKSPDDPFGKVGVTGSGKGLTDFQKREKHLHLKGGSAENDEEAS